MHRYLRGAPGFAAGPMKEYHVWNGICLPDEALPAFEGDKAGKKARIRAEFIASPGRYFDHFAELLSAPRAAITADVTPAYAALPASALARIRGGFAARGIRVKAVFLMRDPVERAWSALRMYRRKGLLPGILDGAGDDDALLARFAQSDHALRRGRYEHTVEALDRTFAPEEIYFGFYEDLFEPERIDALSRFLSIPSRPEAREDRYNVSPRTQTLSPTAHRAVRDAYGETLRFCANRFPQVRRLWGSYAEID